MVGELTWVERVVSDGPELAEKTMIMGGSNLVVVGEVDSQAVEQDVVVRAEAHDVAVSVRAVVRGARTRSCVGRWRSSSVRSGRKTSELEVAGTPGAGVATLAYRTGGGQLGTGS